MSSSPKGLSISEERPDEICWLVRRYLMVLNGRVHPPGTHTVIILGLTVHYTHVSDAKSFDG
jgi:hypothetical protein